MREKRLYVAPTQPDRRGPGGQGEAGAARELQAFGFDDERARKVAVLPPDATRKETAILTNPTDEPEAAAVTAMASRSNASN